jgi:hypothetical protein
MIALNRFKLASLPCCVDTRSKDREAKLTDAPSNCDFEILMGSKIFAYACSDQRPALNLHR